MASFAPALQWCIQSQTQTQTEQMQNMEGTRGEDMSLKKTKGKLTNLGVNSIKKTVSSAHPPPPDP